MTENNTNKGNFLITYLFRAKRIDNGEWVEGFLTSMFRQFHIINPENENMAYQIDEDTICKCTGRKDEDGKRIWENDIVSFLDMYSTENGYSEHGCVGKVCWDNETLSFQVTNRLSAESYEVLDDCLVIGNSFDNPELLEDGE